MDLDGNPIFYNQKCTELHGISLGEASGKGWEKAVHPDDRERVSASWSAAAGAGRPWAEIYRFLHRDGRIVWVSGRATPLRVAGQPAQFVGTLEDITELKEAEIEHARLLGLARDARARAERSTQRRDEILSVVAHDLHNPLHVIAIGLETMRKLPLANDRGMNRRLDIMQRTLQGMNRLIDDLLDVTQIEAGNLVVEQECVQVQALLKDVLELFEAPARERRISLTCDALEALPCVIGDRDRLSQALSNFIGNAIKFTRAHGRISVHVRLSGPGSPLHFSIEDTGPGIPKEDLPHLFERFWQADRRARVGTGLGLAIAKGIVEAHGGRTWAESVLGCGTTFHFTIPCARAGPS